MLTKARALLIVAICCVGACKKSSEPAGGGQPGEGENRHQGEGRVHNAAEGFSIVQPKNWKTGNASATRGAFLVLLGPDASPVNLNVRSITYDGLPVEKIGEQVKNALSKQLPSFHLHEDGVTSIEQQNAYFITYGIQAPAPGNPTGKAGGLDMKLIQYFVVGKNKKKAFILTFTALASEFEKYQKTFAEAAASVRTD